MKLPKLQIKKSIEDPKEYKFFKYTFQIALAGS